MINCKKRLKFLTNPCQMGKDHLFGQISYLKMVIKPVNKIIKSEC